MNESQSVVDTWSCALPARVRGVVFDGDDTLWLTEMLYDNARAAARSVVELAGFSGEEWERLQRELDVANVIRFGHSAERFPTSCVEALAEVAGSAPVVGELRDAVWTAASSVFRERAPLRANAFTVLADLHDLGIRVALLTKGDPTVQQQRVAESGLQTCFDVISIVEHKTSDSFGEVAASLGIPVEELISVGNSVSSDSVPSAAAKICPLLIDAHVWEYERRVVDASCNPHQLVDLEEIVAIVRQRRV